MWCVASPFSTRMQGPGLRRRRKPASTSSYASNVVLVWTKVVPIVFTTSGGMGVQFQRRYGTHTGLEHLAEEKKIPNGASGTYLVLAGTSVSTRLSLLTYY